MYVYSCIMLAYNKCILLLLVQLTEHFLSFLRVSSCHYWRTKSCHIK